MLMPKRVKRRRQMRGRMKGSANKGNRIAYGEYGLVATEPSWITSNQIEAARVAMTRYIKRGGQVWVDICPHKPVTAKPAETRMGSGCKTRSRNVRNGRRVRGNRKRSAEACLRETPHQMQDLQQGTT